MTEIDYWEKLFDKTYLRWFHLNGKPALVRITKIERKELTLRGGAKKKSGIIHLEQVNGSIEEIKPLVLNVTNGESIAEIHGTKPVDWVGREIVLFETTRNLKGKPVPCIAVRAKRNDATGKKNNQAVPVTETMPSETGNDIDTANEAAVDTTGTS